MSASSADVVRTMTGMCFSSGSFLIYSRTSWPLFFGQIEIQKHEMGGPGADIFALATKIAQRCFPIPHHIELIGYPGTLEGFPGEADITRAVFDKEDLNRFG